MTTRKENEPMSTTESAHFVTGVQQGWHAIDATPFPGCGKHAWALCGAIVRMAGEKYQPYDPSSVPVSYDYCPLCRWTVAAATGDFDAALRDLGHPLAIATATAILEQSGRLEQGVDDPATIQLLAAVAAHTPVLLVTEDAAEEGGCLGCVDPPCHGCSGRLACKACSLQEGSWAGEWEGMYRQACTIEAPCAVLLALAEHAGVKS